MVFILELKNRVLVLSMILFAFHMLPTMLNAVLVFPILI